MLVEELARGICEEGEEKGYIRLAAVAKRRTTIVSYTKPDLTRKSSQESYDIQANMNRKYVTHRPQSKSQYMRGIMQDDCPDARHF